MIVYNAMIYIDVNNIDSYEQCLLKDRHRFLHSGITTHDYLEKYFMTGHHVDTWCAHICL